MTAAAAAKKRRYKQGHCVRTHIFVLIKEKLGKNRWNVLLVKKFSFFHSLFIVVVLSIGAYEIFYVHHLVFSHMLLLRYITFRWFDHDIELSVLSISLQSHVSFFMQREREED
jgi:hypothetical protein